jgi:monovalent cation/proton antiporter MnhG/PhaG subunit
VTFAVAINVADLAVEVSLAICVVTSLICCLGLLLMNDVYEKMHYMATVSTIASFFLLAAVVIKEGAGQAAIKASLIFAVLLITNAVLTHATARAARVRTFGAWDVPPETPVPPGGSIGEKLGDKARDLNEC